MLASWLARRSNDPMRLTRARRVANAKEIAADWTPPRVRSGGVKVPLERLKDYGEVEATRPEPKARRRV